MSDLWAAPWACAISRNFAREYQRGSRASFAAGVFEGIPYGAVHVFQELPESFPQAAHVDCFARNRTREVDMLAEVSSFWWILEFLLTRLSRRHNNDNATLNVAPIASLILLSWSRPSFLARCNNSPSIYAWSVILSRWTRAMLPSFRTWKRKLIELFRNLNTLLQNSVECWFILLVYYSSWAKFKYSSARQWPRRRITENNNTDSQCK